MQKIIEDNLKLAFSFAHKFNKEHGHAKYDYDEIVSDCLLGLVKAAQHFDSTLGINFSTFAHICMKNEIMMSLRVKKRACDHTFNLDIFDKDGDRLEDIISIFAELNDSGEQEKVIDLLWLKDALKNLSKLEKQVISMYYFGEVKIYQIADLLGFTESYISKIHGNALKKMRKIAL